MNWVTYSQSGDHDSCVQMHQQLNPTDRVNQHALGYAFEVSPIKV
mgnify:CR=1